MSESKGATRAVDRMVDAIRADEPPQLDWDAMERSLLLRVRRGEGARPVARPSSGVWQVLSFAAAAAIVPFALSASSAGSGRPLVVTEEVRAVDAAKMAALPGSAGARDLAALRSGDAIEASADAVTFADAGKVRWTLSPDSRLVVRSPLQEGATPGRPGAASSAPVMAAGVGHVVRLERGSLRVEVEPELAKGGFVDVLAVEVGHTRVAVHGTVFTVTVVGDEVVVDVERGVVTVGPTGQRGATTGYELPAGSRAAFSLDGGRAARWVAPGDALPAAIAATNGRRPAMAPAHGGAAPIAAADEPIAAVEPPAPPVGDDVPAMMDPPPAVAAKVALGPKSAAAAPSEAPAVNAPPAATDAAAPPKPVMTSGGVVSGLKRCFSQAHPSSALDGPKLTASSTFTLKIKQDGSVIAAQFNPPLPSIQGCAAFVWGATFAPAAADYTLSIPVQLSQ